MAATNFLNWNPTIANQESDIAYSADSLRLNGVPTNSPWPSPIGNKTMHQAAIMAAALGQMLASKGYSTSDVNQNALASVLANLITNADFTSLGVITNADLPLAVAKGGTGATSLLAAGIPDTRASVDVFAKNAAIASTALLTPASSGFYRVNMNAKVSVTGFLMAFVTFTQRGQAFGMAITVSGAGYSERVDTLYCDAGTPIKYYTTWSSGTGASYDLHVDVENL